MKPKTMILMGVAIVFGLAASYLTSKLLAEQKKMVKVLQAKEKLNRWTPLKNLDAQFAIVEVIENEAAKNYVPFEKAGEVLNRMLIKTLEKDATLTMDDLMAPGRGGLEAELEKGRRAMAIPISAVTSAGGFVQAGSRVDVLLSTREGAGGTAKVILENVLVKAIDLMPVRPEDRPGMVGSTATLEVTPQESLKLAAVQGTGVLSLALRAYNDTTKMAEPDVDPATVVPPPPPPEKKTEPATPAQGTSVATEQPKPPEEKIVVTAVMNGSVMQERVYYYDDQGRFKRSELRDPQGARPVELRPDARPPERVEKPATVDDLKKLIGSKEPDVVN